MQHACATAPRPGRRMIFAGRVSDEDDEDKSYGLEIQEDDVRAFARAEDWDLIVDLRKQETQLQAQARAALDLGLVGKLACELLEAKLAETEREIETVRAQIRGAEARLALARADIPSEQQVAEICRQLSKGAYYADAKSKRELLEALQMKVWVHGEEWWTDGIVPGLHLVGTIQRSQRVQNTNAPGCVRSSPGGPPLDLEHESIIGQLDPFGQLARDAPV
jgi:hypothetical protein